MNMIRFVSTLALTLGIAGCASTPNSVPVSTAPVTAKPADTATLDLPDRVARAPKKTKVPEPVRVAASPEPVSLPDVTHTAQATPTPAPIDLGAYDAVLEPPATEYVEIASTNPNFLPPPEPVAYIDQQFEADPSYVTAALLPGDSGGPLLRGQMAPIRDDPIDTVDQQPRRATSYNVAALKAAYRPSEALTIPAPAPKVRNAHTPEFGRQLSDSALSRLNPNVSYVASYKKIGYPWGDVSEDTGVCTDVVIRSFRGLGIDLQSMVHEDMLQAFNAYPSKKIYGLTKADPNIDHRRVVNLEAFFERVGAAIPVGSDYQPGDVITWRLSGGEPHIGVVVNRLDPKTGNPLIVHNLGAGVRAEDLLDYALPHGAYRFAPDQQSRIASLALKRG